MMMIGECHKTGVYETGKEKGRCHVGKISQSVTTSKQTSLIHIQTQNFSRTGQETSVAQPKHPQRLLATHRNTLRAAVVVHSHRHLAVTLVV